MKGMIFAAGIGSRLAPLTDHTPKALIEVGGCPMIERVILKLKAIGVNDLVINVHHHAHQIVQFLNENSNFGMTINVSDESDELLDTGGGIRKALHWLRGDEYVIVHNADIYTDVNLSQLIADHNRSEADVTLLVSERDTSRYLMFDDSGRMRGWHNTVTGEYKPDAIAGLSLIPYAFGGIHVLSPSALDALGDYRSESPKFSIIPFYIHECEHLNIRGYRQQSPYYWYDIGRLSTLEQARRHAALLRE